MINVNSLNSAPECDAVLVLVQKQHSDLTYRHSTLTRSHGHHFKTNADVSAQLTAINLEVEAIQALLPTLPEGKRKKTLTEDLKRLELQQFLLSNRLIDYNVIELIEKEVELELVTTNLAKIEEVRTAIEARRAELEAAA